MSVSPHLLRGLHSRTHRVLLLPLLTLLLRRRLRVLLRTESEARFLCPKADLLRGEQQGLRKECTPLR